MPPPVSQQNGQQVATIPCSQETRPHGLVSPCLIGPFLASFPAAPHVHSTQWCCTRSAVWTAGFAILPYGTRSRRMAGALTRGRAGAVSRTTSVVAAAVGAWVAAPCGAIHRCIHTLRARLRLDAALDHPWLPARRDDIPQRADHCCRRVDATPLPVAVSTSSVVRVGQTRNIPASGTLLASGGKAIQIGLPAHVLEPYRPYGLPGRLQSRTARSLRRG